MSLHLSTYPALEYVSSVSIGRPAPGLSTRRDLGLLDEHHGDPVADRVPPTALGADEARCLLVEADRRARVAGGAGEDLEELGVDHGGTIRRRRRRVNGVAPDAAARYRPDSVFVAEIVLAALLARPRAVPPPAAPPAGIAPAETPPAELVVGEEGYGLTVLSGARIETFAVRYVGRLERALPGQDLLLIRIVDPRFETSGVVAGMSGSPIHFRGRCVGALAYGWTFSREPIAGVTPIEAMREVGSPRGGGAAGGGAGAPPPPGLAPISAPLWTSGIPAEALGPHLGRLRALGLEPIPAGKAAREAGVAEPDLVPGAAVGVQLMRGDLEMTAIGTVTERTGERILAFGHPLLGLGGPNLPMTTAVIHTVMPSLAQSFKLGSPVRAVGRLTGDAQAAIAGEIGGVPEMIPVTVRLSSPNGKRTMRMEVAEHRLLTPLLLEIAWSSAANAALWGLGEATLEVGVSAVIRTPDGAERTVVYRDAGYGPFSPLQAAPLGPLQWLLENPEARIRLRSVEVSLEATPERRTAEVVDAGAVERTVRPGETVTVWARIAPYDGADEIRRVVIPLPAETPEGDLRIWVGGGRGRWLPGRPYPRDLDGWFRLVEEVEPVTDLVAEAALPPVGAEVDGRVLPGLPSTYAALHDARPALALRVRASVPTPWILDGGRSVTVRVEEDGE